MLRLVRPLVKIFCRAVQANLRHVEQELFSPNMFRLEMFAAVSCMAYSPLVAPSFNLFPIAECNVWKGFPLSIDAKASIYGL